MMPVRQRIDLAETLAQWRRRPLSVALLVTAVVGITNLVVLVGGPPTPLTHLYYLAIILAAALWGPWWGAAAGVACGVLADPGARLLLGDLTGLDDSWVLRALVMALVGWVCGSLMRSLLARMRDLERHNHETVFAFVRAIDARDPYTARHSENVATYAVRLAHALGLEHSARERIALAALLHDVGKVAMERSVLNKPGALDDEEWAQMREHPERSAHILAGVARFAAFVPGARHHHEWFDGSGYPDGLAGQDIPLDARIIAVADAYEAMTSDRSYRPALSRDEALHRIDAGAGTQFDPICSAAFVRVERSAGTVPEALAPVLALGPLRI